MSALSENHCPEWPGITVRFAQEYAPEYREVKKSLHKRLHSILEATKDPRVIGGGEKFDEFPYRVVYKLNLGKKD